MRADTSTNSVDEAKIVSFEDEGLRLDSSEDAEVICARLAGIDFEILKLQGNTFSIEAAERVGLELANHPNLKEAHFKDLFTSRGREEVPDAMKHLLRGINTSGAQLTLLDLSDNAIGPIGAPSLIEFLESPSAESIESLYINNCGMGPEGSTSIAASIPRLKKLRTLICGRNRLENKGATNMSRALKELKNLEVLSFQQNGIFVEGIEQLASVLKANKNTIVEFDFSDNTIKSEGARALADAIAQMTNLKVVRIDDALLLNEGFKILCDGFSKSPSLKKITKASFEGNELFGNKLIDIVESTFVNSLDHEFELNLLENGFSNDQLRRLESFSDSIVIYVDDIDSDNDAETEEEDEEDITNGFVDLGYFESELREIMQDFLKTFEQKPFDAEEANRAFNEFVSRLTRSINDSHSTTSSDPMLDVRATQIAGEELGLIKCESDGKRKSLERDAISYINKHRHELPESFRNFLQVIQGKQ